VSSTGVELLTPGDCGGAGECEDKTAEELRDGLSRGGYPTRGLVKDLGTFSLFPALLCCLLWT
jgi:hypothetical protein